MDDIFNSFIINIKNQITVFKNNITGYLHVFRDNVLLKSGFKPVSLTISKTIRDTDLNNDPYEPTSEELDFQFEFTVEIISEDLNDDIKYTYYLNNIPYSFSSGENIYLRHGESALFNNIVTGTYYRVTEKNYVEIDENETLHGWVSFTDNSHGYIEKEGIFIHFDNVKIPEIPDITIS